MKPGPSCSEAQGNWHGWQAVEEHLQVTRGHTKATLKPPLRGAPAILEDHLGAKWGEIKKDAEGNEGLGPNAQNALKQVPARAEFTHATAVKGAGTVHQPRTKR